MMCMPDNKGKKLLWPCGTASRKGHGLEALLQEKRYTCKAFEKHLVFIWENFPMHCFCQDTNYDLEALVENKPKVVWNGLPTRQPV